MASDYRLGMVPLAELRFDNVRENFGDEEALRQLGESLKKRQHQPLFCLEGGLVYDGERRVRAARLVGLTELLAVVTETPLTPLERTELQFETAFFREDLTGYEKFQAVSAIQAAHPDWPNKRLAEHLHVDPKMIKVLLAPASCIPQAVDALRQNRVGISVCHDLSLLPLEEQPPLLELALAGASRDAVARAGRKQRAGTAPAARAGRLKVVLASGVVITVGGDDPLSLGEAIEELSEALSEMRKAEKQGLDAKTFAAVCRDRAKAGVR